MLVENITKDKLWESDIQAIRQKTGKIVVGTQDLIRHHGKRLICPKCEGGAFRHGTKYSARCNVCGWQGQSITVDEYITQKLYK